MTDLPYSSWQNSYQEAVLECDPLKVEGKILAAENAIYRRFQELAGDSNGAEERMALNGAVRALRVLQTEKLNYPKMPTEYLLHQ